MVVKLFFYVEEIYCEAGLLHVRVVLCTLVIPCFFRPSVCPFALPADPRLEAVVISFDLTLSVGLVFYRGRGAQFDCLRPRKQGPYLLRSCEDQILTITQTISDGC